MVSVQQLTEREDSSLLASHTKDGGYLRRIILLITVAAMKLAQDPNQLLERARIHLDRARVYAYGDNPLAASVQTNRRRVRRRGEISCR
jgi:hypothetical protein